MVYKYIVKYDTIIMKWSSLILITSSQKRMDEKGKKDEVLLQSWKMYNFKSKKGW